MAHIIKDRILETCSGSGTTNISLTGSIKGFSAFSTVCGNNDTFDYYIEAIDNNGALTGAWETGTGTYISGTNTIIRTTVKGSSNNNNPVNFSAFIGRVGITIGADWNQTLVVPANRIETVSDRKIGNPLVAITQQEINEIVLSSGTISGFNLIDNGDGSVNISSGVALIRTFDSSIAPLMTTQISGSTIILQDDALNYICVYYNAGNPILVSVVDQATVNGRDYSIVYAIYRSGTLLHNIDFRGQIIDSNRNMRFLFLNFSRFIHAANGTVLGSNGLALTLTSGVFYVMINPIPHAAFDTSIAGTSIVNVFKRWIRNGIGGWIGVENEKIIDTTTYDNNTGVPATLTNNKYGVSWVYVMHNTPSELHVVKGQEQYNSLSDAQSAKIPTQLPGVLSVMGSLVGAVIYKKGNTVFDDVRSAFTSTLVSSSPVTHNTLSTIQGGMFNEYYHLTNSEYIGTGTGNFVRQSTPIINKSISISNGNNFCALRTLFSQTTNNISTKLTTDGLSASQTNQIVLGNNTIISFRGQIVAQNIANISDSKVWEFKGAIRRDGGTATTTIIGSPIIDTIASDGSTWLITFSADTINGALSIDVIGENGKTLKWFATIQITNLVV